MLFRSGRLKAIAGRTGGAVCTSSNAHHVMDWALAQGRRILFLPDRHLGRNTAVRLGLDPEALCRTANRRFQTRFRAMEETLGGTLTGRSLDQLLAAWGAAKEAEAGR